MELVVFAAASAFTFALVSVLDKILISDYIGSGKTFGRHLYCTRNGCKDTPENGKKWEGDWWL